MKRKLLIADGIHPSAIEILERHRNELTWEIVSENDFPHKLNDASFAIVKSSLFTAEMIRSSKSLKLIVRAGVGTETIDLKAAEERHIQVDTTQEANATSTAELTIGLLLNLLRNISTAEFQVRAGEWKESSFRKQFRGVEIAGKKVGIVGLGRIGKRVAKRLSAFEAEVFACDPYLSKEETKSFAMLPYQEILQTSEILSFHIPLNKETHRIFGKKEISISEHKPWVINTSRGEIVDEVEVVAGVKFGKLSGYATDVFEKEPIAADSPLLTCERIVFSPHLGAQTLEAQERVGIAAVQKVVEFIFDPKANAEGSIK